MAPWNTFDSYDYANAINEDISQIIHNVTPYDTPFYSKCRKTTASNTLHEWLTSSLRASATNAHIEGDNTTSEARTQESRLSNQSQIFKNAVTASDTDEGLNFTCRQSTSHGIRDATSGSGTEAGHREGALCIKCKSRGNSTTALQLAGAPTWMITNVDFQSGNSGANPTGDGTDAPTDDGTPTSIFTDKVRLCSSVYVGKWRHTINMLFVCIPDE